MCLILNFLNSLFFPFVVLEVLKLFKINMINGAVGLKKALHAFTPSANIPFLMKSAPFKICLTFVAETAITEVRH